MPPMARVVSLSVLTTLIVFLGITFYQVVTPFLLPLFLAGVLTILTHPLFQFFVRKTNNRTRVAAGLTTATVMLLILIPLLVGIVAAAVQLHGVATDGTTATRWGESIQSLRKNLSSEEFDGRVMTWIKPFVDEEMTPEDFHERRDAFERELLQNTQESLRLLAGRTLGLAGATLGFLGGLVGALLGFLIFAIALYYFLADGPALLEAAQSLIPVHSDYQRQLVVRFEQVVRAVVMATFASAIVQGLATATLLYVAGIRHFFIFFMVTTCTAVIPLAGTWVVWGPCAVWLAWQGHWGTAAFVAIVGALLIGTMDNVIKTYVLHSDAKLHPLLAFISVLGGLRTMGLWGVFIGPIVASCLHALVQIFNVELKALSKERQAERSKSKSGKTKRRSRSSRGGSKASHASDSGVKQTDADSTDESADERPARSRKRRRRRRKRRPEGAESEQQDAKSAT